MMSVTHTAHTISAIVTITIEAVVIITVGAVVVWLLVVVVVIILVVWLLVVVVVVWLLVVVNVMIGSVTESLAISVVTPLLESDLIDFCRPIVRSLLAAKCLLSTLFDERRVVVTSIAAAHSGTVLESDKT